MKFTFNFIKSVNAFYEDGGVEIGLIENQEYSLPVTIILKTGGQFIGTPYIEYKGSYDFGDSTSTVDFNLNAENNRAEITFNEGAQESEPAIIHAESDATDGINYSFNFNNTENITSNINMSNNSFKLGDAPIVTITADNGYYFESRPEIKFNTPTGQEESAYFKTDIAEPPITQYYIDVENVFALNIYDSDIIFNLTNITPVKIPPEGLKDYGVLDLYSLSSDKLRQLELMTFTDYELSDFILELNRLFIDVDDIKNQNIVLGGYDTQIKGDLIKTDNVELDLGNVTINGKYNNASDYNNSEIEIFLPFLGFRNLNVDKFMDKTINLIYKVSLLKGETKILIYDVINQNEKILIESYDCKVGYGIPYFLEVTKVRESMTLNGSIDFNANYFMGFKPYIIHRYYESIEPIYKKEFEVNDFNNLTGFYKFNDIELNKQGLLKSEYEEIKALLKEGVIF